MNEHTQEIFKSLFMWLTIAFFLYLIASSKPRIRIECEKGDTQCVEAAERIANKLAVKREQAKAVK